MRRERWDAIIAISVSVVLVAVACRPGPAADDDPTEAPTAPSSIAPDEGEQHRAQDRQVALARRRIEHVVYLIKENRTFDTMFGRFPGADGVTEGVTCDGRAVPLARAPDDAPGPDHSFQAGLMAINGGRMNCFDELYGGFDLQGYVQYRPDQIPNYWAYAENFVLADRFFSSTYGPTGIEHLFTVGPRPTASPITSEPRPLDSSGSTGYPASTARIPASGCGRSGGSPSRRSRKLSRSRSAQRSGP